MHLTCPPSELRHASAQCPPASMNTPPRRACSCSPARACAGRAQANQVQHTLPGLQTRCATLCPPSRRLTPRVVLPPHDQLACPQPLKGDCSEMLRVAWNMTPRAAHGRRRGGKCRCWTESTWSRSCSSHTTAVGTKTRTRSVGACLPRCLCTCTICHAHARMHTCRRSHARLKTAQSGRWIPCAGPSSCGQDDVLIFAMACRRA